MASYSGEKARGVPIPSESHLKLVCKHGKGADACKFLAIGGKDGPLCMAGNTGFRQSHFYRKSDMGRTYPTDPQGENCTGAPDFILTTKI